MSEPLLDIINSIQFFDTTKPEYYKETYIQLLRTTLEERNKRLKTDTDIESCIEWISNTSFFTEPASSRFHEPFEGGLVNHTLKVALMITHLIYIPEFENIPLDSAILVALVHDWCKIGTYESYFRNVKDNRTGVWNQVKSYKHKERISYSMGHGAASLFLADRAVGGLSTEEALAIRWHMGRWNVSDNEVNEFQQSNEMYPLVHLLQFADQLAITDYANLNGTPNKKVNKG